MRRGGRGFSMVEAVMAVVMTAIVIVGAMTTLGSVGRSRLVSLEQATARPLALELLAEIQNQPYGAPSLGGVAPSLAGDRSAFDEVGDYRGWTSMPPETKSGGAMGDLARWSREVELSWINADGTSALSETGLVRVTVRVKNNGRQVCSAMAVRARAWDESQPPFEMLNDDGSTIDVFDLDP
ncbi:MAG: hypothetical protein H6811_03025 [Phycisphaeraceae bacterium]|nr:hypothetical protein [Phycisphaeraceae bacterium]